MTSIGNPAKARLQAGKVAFGLQVKILRTVEVARAAASRGYHYLGLDLEHSTMDLDTCAQICAAALDAGITSLVRVPGREGYHATRVLDGGAQGIIVPHIETAEEAREVVQNCRFPPYGSRSPGGSTIQLAWAAKPAKEVARLLDENLLVGVVVESKKALDNIEEIVAVEGLDFLSVGTSDLTQDMGISGESDHPELLAAYRRIVTAANRKGKFVRLGNFGEPNLLARNIEMGARLVTAATDIKLFLKGMETSISAIQQKVDASLI